MKTIGVVGVGKIGLPIAGNLIKSGHRVVGYRRSSLAEFEKIGGVPARSAADVSAQADIVFSVGASARRCRSRPARTHPSARAGQVVVELGSHPLRDQERQVALLARNGAAFVDGEVSGSPGMVAARKAVIYLAGDAGACKTAEQAVVGFADACFYFGEFGAASRVKLVNNLLVAINIAAAAEAVALGLEAGVDVPLMIKAIANGSGGSTRFTIRAPAMAERRFFPVRPRPETFGTISA